MSSSAGVDAHPGFRDEGVEGGPSIEARTPPYSGFLGHIPQVRADPLGTVLRWNREYGDVVRVRLRHWGYLVVDPRDIRHLLVSHASRYRKGETFRIGRKVFGQGLLASEEPLHLAQRHLMQPAFHREALAGYADTMVERSLRITEGWGERAERDIASEMTRLTLGIAARTMFGLEDVEETEALARAVDVAQDFLYRRATSPILPPDWLPTPLNVRHHHAVEVMDRLVYRVIAERRSARGAPTDLLGMLLAARDDEGRGMADRQLRDEILTLLLAGHDTTANALSWSIYLLSTHPEVEEKLLGELRQVLGGRPPEVSDLARMAYTEMVFSEALRLYPPAWIIPRWAVAEDTLATGTAIHPETPVTAMPWVTHRNPAWFPEPEAFRPERFLPAAKEGRPPYAYFPFGGGTRRCIGEPFARMEAMLVLGTLLPQYRFELLPGQRIVPEPRVTLRPRGGIRFRITRRPAIAG
jgi:cytochrome P450